MCSATDGGKKGKSTDTMQNNCGEHFEQTINILKPSVLVCQGDRVSQWVRRTFGVTPRGPQEGTIRTLGTRVIEFSHPAAWGDKNWGWNDNPPYLLETVEPTVRRVREDMIRKT
jgi:uracil-DNA glycosylase